MRMKTRISLGALLAAVCLLPCIASRTVDAWRFNQSTPTTTAYNACVGNETFACSDGRCIPRTWRCDGDIDCKGEEDEKDCSDTCGAEEFRCGHEQSGPAFKANHNPCIPMKWKCDGEFDCDDKSDEKDCGDVHCNENQFTCNEFDGQYKLCIPKTWRCDGQKDCASGEDEENCHEKKCRESDHQCDNGICIFKNWICDGEDDCGDGSDEKNCTTTADKHCEEKHMFKCKKSDGCIPKDWVCDGEADCLDHSDERECEAKPHTCKRPGLEFACVSGNTCISSMWRCDGEEDCSDGSDEKDCGKVRECVKDEFQCPNGWCIGGNLRCDGNDDCVDGADELNCSSSEPVNCKEHVEYECPGEPKQCIPFKELCTNKNRVCSDDTSSECRNNHTDCKAGSEGCTCHNSYIKGAKICYCKEGWKSVGGVCQDIDECQQLGVCDQVCVNKPGSYECACIRGYKLSHDKNSPIPSKCRAVGGDPIVLLSNRASIRQYDLVTNTFAPLIQTPGSAVAMDFHLTNRTLIWSDIARQHIMMCTIGNDSVDHHLTVDGCESDKTILVSEDVHTPDGLAIDWIHNLLFWTDGGLDQVNVLDLNTRKKKTLFKVDLEEPRAIAVDPEMGLIFWTDWGKTARIERAGMDGQNRQVIISGDHVKWPNGLALDYVNKRVYWADAKIKSIFSCDYWGKDVKTVLHSHQYLRHPFSMAVFEDRVYYTDWEHDGVNSVNKFHGGDARKVMQKVTTPMTVRIYHQQAQPDLDNKCKNSGCGEESMCLPRAVYREENKKSEQPWRDHPFACVCGGDKEIIECAMTMATVGAADGFSLSTMLFFLMLVIFTVMGVVYYRRRKDASSFTALNFDNPIYRRTVEPEMEDPFRDPFNEETRNSRLVIGAQDVDSEIQNPTSNGSMPI